MWSIIGHGPALALLDKAIDGERPPHAWLFVGPEGMGKRAVALEFAAALNCTGADRPCGECRSCRDTLALSHPDVEVVAPGGICDEPDHRDHPDSRDLRICQIRRIERILALSPYSGRRRVAIIDAADTMHAESANAFLKTLEEPPEGSVIVLLVEREERLPETVASRCQRAAFRPLQRAQISEALQTKGVEPERAEEIASIAGGRIGWALRASEEPGLLEERRVMIDEAVRLAHAGRSERFAWARAAESRSPEVRERYLRELQVWESWWRDVLQAGSGSLEGLINAGRASELAREGRMFADADIVAFLRVLLQTREYLQLTVDPQLALENLMLDLPWATRAPATR